MNHPHVGIFGVGAIGSIMTSYLQKEDHIKLHLFNRSPKEIIRLQWENQWNSIPIQLSQQLPENTSLDLLIICLKKYQISEAITSIIPLVASHTKVLILGNGIDQTKVFSKYFSSHNLFEATIDCPTDKLENGDLIVHGNPELICSQETWNQTLGKIALKHSISVRIPENYHDASWSKLVESAALGTLMVVVNGDCGDIRKQNKIELLQELFQEGILVGQADHATFPLNFLEILMKRFDQYPDGKNSSMLSDFRNHQPIETEAKNVAILKKARQYKLDTPVYEKFTQQIEVKLQERQYKSVEKSFGLFADRYADSYMDKPMYPYSLQQFVNIFSKNNSIEFLEVGCGPGNITKQLLQLNENIEITGVDISEKMINVARKLVPQAQFKVMNANEIHLLQKKFHGMLFTFCFPYIDQFEISDILRKTIQQLKPDGYLYISTIHGDYKNSKITRSSTGEGEPMMMYYYDYPLLKDVLNKTGFEIKWHAVEQREKDKKESDHDLLIIAHPKR